MISRTEIILALSVAVVVYECLPRETFGSYKIVGLARAVDGDTIHFAAGRKVRLASIDSCELKQVGIDDSGRQIACGVIAKAWLSNELAKGNVSCDTYSTDFYGRMVARCYVNGRDIGEASVRAGMAIADTRLAHGIWLNVRYFAAQALAAWDNNGIWGYKVLHPKAFRHFQVPE